jgi:hypothetical protein
VHGIGALHARDVVLVAHGLRQFVLLLLVEPAEGPAHVLDAFLVLDALEEALAHDGEALFGAHRFPYRLHALEVVLQGAQRRDAPCATRFAIALGQRGQQHGVGHFTCGLRERLDEGEVALVAAARVFLSFLELAEVGHHFIHEDHARPMVLQHGREHVLAGRGAAHVALLDARIRLCATELPYQLAPERMHLDAVHHLGLVGAELDAIEHHDARLRQGVNTFGLQQGLQRRNGVCWHIAPWPCGTREHACAFCRRRRPFAIGSPDRRPCRAGA